jgi:hypothetical protein
MSFLPSVVSEPYVRRGGVAKATGGMPFTPFPLAACLIRFLSARRAAKTATRAKEKLSVSVEIEADMPDEGAPEHVRRRTVSENARVLKFETHGFESE